MSNTDWSPSATPVIKPFVANTVSNAALVASPWSPWTALVEASAYNLSK